MVVDPISDRVLLYSTNGLPLGALSKELTNNEMVDGSDKASSSYILKLSGPKALILNERLTRINSNLDLGRSGDGTGGFGALYNWATASDQLFAVGTFHSSESLENSSSNYQLGFLRGRLKRGSVHVEKVELVKPFDFSPYYMLGHRYVTVNDDAAFFLSMKGSAELYTMSLSSEQGLRKLKPTALPSEYSQVPSLPAAAGPSDASLIFRAIESNSLLVGIYGYGHMLYLLARSPSGNQTTWWLYQIDPQQDKIMGRLLLPTAAHHITIVPSPTSWFIFEKGPVVAAGLQKIESLITVPTDWIVNVTSSPLRERNNKSTGKDLCARMDKKKKA